MAVTASDIPPSSENNFLSLLAQAARGVLLSWSSAYVAGSHQNARPRKYIADKMKTVAGMHLDATATAAGASRLVSGIKASFMVYKKTPLPTSWVS